MLTVAKVLQVLANNARFGTKESGLTELNAFLERNQPPYLKAFTEWISGSAATGGTFAPAELPYSELQERYDYLVGYFAENMAKFQGSGILGAPDKADTLRKTVSQFGVLFAQHRLQTQDWNAKHARKQKASTESAAK